MTKYPCIESMTRIELPFGRIMRIWRDETENGIDFKIANLDVTIATERYLTDNNIFDGNELLKIIAAMPRVSAVELIDSYGNGTVIYVTWP